MTSAVRVATMRDVPAGSAAVRGAQFPERDRVLVVMAATGHRGRAPMLRLGGCRRCVVAWWTALGLTHFSG
jgi:hypothetical protein